MEEYELTDIAYHDCYYTTKGRIKCSDCNVFVKKYKLREQIKAEYIMGEIAFLAENQSQFMPKYYRSIYLHKQKELWVVTELGTSVNEFLCSEIKLTESECSVIIREVLAALVFFSKKNVNHLAVSSTSVVIIDNRVTLVDFRFVKHPELYRSDSVSFRFAFLAPEIQKREEANYKADIWGLGVVLYELCTGKYPYEHFDPLKMLFHMQTRPDLVSLLGDEYSNDVKDFIGKCVLANASARATYEELLVHPFITTWQHLDTTETLRNVIAKYQNAEQ